MSIVGCHPDDLRYSPISSGWHNVIWTLSHPDELAPGRISSGGILDTAACHPDDLSYHRMSSGRLSRNWYLIRMSYDNVIMSSGWQRLPFLSHSDEIANFDFPHHAVAFQRFRIIRMTYGHCRMSSGWPTLLAFVIRMKWLIWSLSHPDDLAVLSISFRWLMDIVVCHSDDIWYCPVASGRHNIIWTLSHRMCWLPIVSHPDDLWPIHYVIRMT